MNILKKPLFYIAFLIGFVVASYVFWWNWLWLWTTKQTIKLEQKYVKSNLVDDTAVKLVFVGIDLLNWNYSNKVLIKNSIDLIYQADLLIKLNIIDYLLNASNKGSALEAFINRVNNVLSKIDNVTNQLNYLVNDFNQKYNFCLSQKSLWDTNFFLWLKNKDFEITLQWLNLSAENAACSEKNRVYAHAYQIIYVSLKKRSDILRQKLNLISNNQVLLLQNIELFKNNYLDDLLELKDRLANLNYNSF